MIRIKVIEVDCTWARLPDHEAEQLGPIEDFIAQVGYQNIKEIKVQSSGGPSGYYHIIYEDGLPFTPYVEEEPKKKGIFG